MSASTSGFTTSWRYWPGFEPSVASPDIKSPFKTTSCGFSLVRTSDITFFVIESSVASDRGQQTRITITHYNGDKILSAKCRSLKIEI
jgi:hypothetical protein